MLSGIIIINFFLISFIFKRHSVMTNCKMEMRRVLTAAGHVLLHAQPAVTDCKMEMRRVLTAAVHVLLRAVGVI